MLLILKYILVYLNVAIESKKLRFIPVLFSTITIKSIQDEFKS